MINTYVDGHLYGRNGQCNGGFSLISIDGRVKRIDYDRICLTNTEAELMAIAHGTLYAPMDSTILSDSLWSVKAITQGYSIKEPRIQLLVIFCRTALAAKGIEIKWIPREENTIT